MPNDNSSALDKDSRGELDAVKKGKSRRFVMLCKGVTIVSLVVYKKGSVESYKKQAKEAGTGQIYYGVVHGPAPEVVFELAASEGFDKEPVKPLVLKQFLKTRASSSSRCLSSSRSNRPYSTKTTRPPLLLQLLRRWPHRRRLPPPAATRCRSSRPA